ncbi:carboxymuconolactone decarboxylase family protein [Roseovarius sp. ZX-A-9]|uniref:carboxymuconolactone decarboxylase family protein n=1 Tax=Roseovarius sp. ZX-A-9 TaxID=3014783 RepID=UPI00232E3F29|nr:carboxymuconolactone decarboxylase family protein [Roseovarius sp. ZX-A-9]
MRNKPLEYKSLSTAQKRVYDQISSGPRGRVGGPFPALLSTPEIADRVQALGASLRFDGKLPSHIREIAILVTSRHWDCLAEWNAHVLIGQAEGLDETVIERIANDSPLPAQPPENALARDLCKELLETQFVNDDLYERATQTFGQDGLVELVTIVGYFAMLSMILNTYEVAPESDYQNIPDHLRLPNV